MGDGVFLNLNAIETRDSGPNDQDDMIVLGYKLKD